MDEGMAGAVPWWRSAVIYQLLVPSYYDSKGDGIGDFRGLTEKLEYLDWLGVDAVWLSPIYASPFAELGYDVSDFTAVNPMFGTMEDFDAMLAEAHRRGIRVLLDWVPNHTSSEHPWFKKSRSSRSNPKRDWYLWRDPRPDGSPPNNWLSIFGGSAWSFDEATGQYYLHTFLEEQPDLNWRHPHVRQAMHDAMRFWLDRGVDGFRLDALDLLVEDEQLRDNPPNPHYDPERDGPDMVLRQIYTRNHPCNHEVVAEMRRLVDEYDDRVLLGELYLEPKEIATYYGQDDAPELHLPLNPIFAGVSWSAEELCGHIEACLDAVPEGCWPSWMVSTHDGSRIASRAGILQAGCGAMLLLTLPGTPVIYYGDEIGMHDVDVPPERERDPQGKRIGRKRDPVRTPMQWNDWPQAGFSPAEPWLPVPEDAPLTNVEVQSGGRSLLEFHRKLLAVRASEPALICGRLTSCTASGGVLFYRREHPAGDCTVALNLTAEPSGADLHRPARVLLSTYLDRDDDVTGTVELRPNEAVLLKHAEREPSP